MPSHSVNAATKREWCELGFYYDRDDEARVCRLTGSRKGYWASRKATGGDGLAQTVQAGIQALAGIELGVRDEPAGIVESGVQVGLYLAAAEALDVGAEEHVGLPDLVAVFSLELLGKFDVST